MVWLAFLDCTGDTESFLRASNPTVTSILLDLISLNYHETLMAPSGQMADKSLEGYDRHVSRPIRRRGRGRDPDRGQRLLLRRRWSLGEEHRPRGVRLGAEDHRRRRVRLGRRLAGGRAQSDRRHRRQDARCRASAT